MGTWRNLGKVNRKGVRKHRLAGPQPPIALPGWRAKKRRSAPPVRTVKSNDVFFFFYNRTVNYGLVKTKIKNRINKIQKRWWWQSKHRPCLKVFCVISLSLRLCQNHHNYLHEPVMLKVKLVQLLLYYLQKICYNNGIQISIHSLFGKNLGRRF